MVLMMGEEQPRCSREAAVSEKCGAARRFSALRSSPVKLNGNFYSQVGTSIQTLFVLMTRTK
jgi:hypothetical protein